MREKRMQFRKIVFSLLLGGLILLPTHLRAQDGQAGVQSLFSFGFGARAMGMGNAYVAMANDPTAVYWNPAGLDHIYQQGFTLFHASLYEGTLYDFLGYAYPTLDLGTFGVGVARIGTGGVVERNAFGEPGATFDWEAYRAYFAYGKQLPWGLAGGLAVKLERSAFSNTLRYGSDVGVGFGLDLGVMYRPEFSDSPWLRDWSVGMNLVNLFSPQIKQGNVADILPLEMRFGIMRTINFLGEGNGFRVLMDFSKSANADMRLAFGTEYNFRNMGMLRIGMDDGSFAFGAGAQYNIFQIDYAFSNPSTDNMLDPVHRVSLSVNFGLNRDEMGAIVRQLREEEDAKIIADIREADKQKFIAEHLQKADEYVKNDKYLDAIVEYQQVLSADPFNQRAKIMLDSTNVMLESGFQDRQQEAVQAALDKDRARLDSEFIEFHFDRGRRFLDKKQYTEALIEFNLTLERDPQNQAVIDAIQTTRRRISEEIGSLVRKGREEFQKQNYSEALRLLSEARLLSGDDANVKKEVDTLVERVKLQENIQKGLMLYDIGQYDEALNIFEGVLEADPNNQFIKQYYDKTKIESATGEVEMDPATEKRYLEGVDKFLLGKYEEAITIWDEILKTHPYNKKVLDAIEDARERIKRSQTN
jgi:tetratricopeptide (TPR) repeat protein